MKIDAEWLRNHQVDIELEGMPICCYCDKPVELGSWADKLWPVYDQLSYHDSCRWKRRGGIK